MAPAKGKELGLLCLLLAVLWRISECQNCGVPFHFYGDYYSLERGTELNTKITQDGLENDLFKGKCMDFREINGTRDADGNYHAKFLFFDSASDCYMCWEMYYRTANVLQYKSSSCYSQSTARSSSQSTLDFVCDDILPQTELLTLFRTALEITNCKTTFEGIYHFTYEVDYGGGGICKSPLSYIIACQEPGSPYVDNQVFRMNWGKCADVLDSKAEDIQFQCMGSWRDENGNVFAAVADRGEEVPRDRFKCMLTRYDQQVQDNKRRWTMSRWAQCNTLRSPYDGDIRLEMQPALFTLMSYPSQSKDAFVYGTQIVESTCNLPRNFTGTWFTSGEFDTDVTINNTHIYFKTKIDQYTFRETYFTCQQNRDSRYLMTAVTVGKCEVDFVCFDFLPRHHNIIRWRMGKPYRATDPEERSEANFLHKKFRQACSWSSFTIDRTDTAWKYQTFLLNPPAPVDAPIGGRYRFVQIGSESEHYVTRIRGITARPRHQIGCREQTTEFKSCMDNSKKIYIDAEYCNTVDHTGRPIGEYDEPDRELSCVGFWMEDMRSYMITYDEEDAVSKFRCWVYERIDWRDLVISRSTRSVCGRTQTARSFRAEEGASLALELYESERLWDDCPQRFNDGHNPFFSETSVYVLGEKGSQSWRQSSYQWGSTGARHTATAYSVICICLFGTFVNLVH